MGFYSRKPDKDITMITERIIKDLIYFTDRWHGLGALLLSRPRSVSQPLGAWSCLRRGHCVAAVCVATGHHLCNITVLITLNIQYLLKNRIVQEDLTVCD